MTDQELDRMMRRVLLDSLQQEEASVQQEVEPFVASRKHQRQIKEMLKDPLKWLRNKTKPIWKLVAQKVAVILLVASVSIGSLMAVSPTVRATVIRWVTEWYETHIAYIFFGEYNDETMAQYGIMNLPDGYSEIVENRIELDDYVGLWYENENGDVILLDYTYMQQGNSAMIYPDEGDTVETIAVNGFEGQVFLPNNKDNVSSIVWIDTDEDLLFTIQACMNKDGILHMAESVSLVK